MAKLTAVDGQEGRSVCPYERIEHGIRSVILFFKQNKTSEKDEQDEKRKRMEKKIEY
jgi:hypothetical protein